MGNQTQNLEIFKLDLGSGGHILNRETAYQDCTTTWQTTVKAGFMQGDV